VGDFQVKRGGERRFPGRLGVFVELDEGWKRGSEGPGREGEGERREREASAFHFFDPTGQAS
jgi:hypothetical protein